MTRDDALRKVKSLYALADSTSPHEAQTALQAAVRLRLRYGIGDDDLAEEEEDVILFGMPVFWYQRKIGKRLDRIRADLMGAFKDMEGHSLRTRVESASRLYSDMKDVLDYDPISNPDKRGLKQRRDELVKEFYEQELSGYKKEEGEYSIHAHRMSVSHTAMACDLRKDVVERIVGRSEKKMWEAQMKLMNQGDV